LTKKAVAPSKPAPAIDELPIGDQVIALRSEGKSFASIAKLVGVERSVEAFSLYVDAVSQKSLPEQKKLRGEENKRLDELERRARANTDPSERDRKLASLRKWRRRLSPS
jgi:hypothetical protein